MAVTYSTKAMARAGLIGGGRVVQLLTKADPEVALEVMRAAAKEVEGPIVEAGMRGEDFVATSAFAALPDGPVAVLNECDSVALLETWLMHVAGRLEAAGISGRLQAAPDVAGPLYNAPEAVAGMWLLSEHEEFLRRPWLNGNPPLGWWVTAERTARVVRDVMAWCGVAGERVWVHAGTGVVLPLEPATSLVLSALTTASEVRVAAQSEDGRHLRQVFLGSEGGVLCGVRDEEDLDPASQLRQLEPMLRHAAADVAHAFLRVGTVAVPPFWFWALPPQSRIYEQAAASSSNQIRALAHLRADYVPDPHVVQVLTSSQLAKTCLDQAKPRERWEVKDLGQDRYLVTARDPGPWLDVDTRPYSSEDTVYSRPQVIDASILTRAREDFGAAILTAEVAEANPTPRHNDCF